MQSRNNYIDFIKGITIILVVMGHVLQYSLPETEYFKNPIFIFIYSFHMPLFMGISGYLFYYSINRSFNEITEKKIKQLIIPLFTWTLLLFIVMKFKKSEPGLLSYIILYFRLLPREYWFLLIVFLCTILTFLITKHFNKWYYHLLIIFIILLIPDFSSSKYLKFMYPIFLAGFLYNLKSVLINKYLVYIISISILTFITILYFWNSDYFVYFSGTQILYRDGFHTEQIENNIMRYLAGIAGSITIIFTAKLIYQRFELSYIQELGRKTLGIYLVHLFLLELISYRQLIILNNMFYLQVIVNTLLILSISLLIVLLLEKWNTTNKFLLGSDVNPKLLTNN